MKQGWKLLSEWNRQLSGTWNPSSWLRQNHREAAPQEETPLSMAHQDACSTPGPWLLLVLFTGSRAWLGEVPEYGVGASKKHFQRSWCSRRLKSLERSTMEQTWNGHRWVSLGTTSNVHLILSWSEFWQWFSKCGARTVTSPGNV